MSPCRLVPLLPLLLWTACSRETTPSAPPPPAAALPSAPPAPGEVGASQPAPLPRTGFTPGEVFRRAFWRHPGPTDEILHAERHEPAGPDDAWSWALAVRASADLLAALRAQDHLNLRPLPPGISPPAPSADLPAWFPTVQPGDEVLAAPGSNFLAIHRPAEGLLYARDHGTGFSRPAR